MKIQLLPTHSAYATDSSRLKRVPVGLTLLQHQIETFDSIVDRRADVIIHQGMTGDGKSLAGELPMLEDRRHRILGMYPTNELIADQGRHLADAIKRWELKPEYRPQVRSLNARILDEHQAQQDVQRQVSLLAFLKNADAILTNPDIFHYIVTGRYVRHSQQPFHVLQPLLDQYRQLTCDEFHLFDQPQVTALLTALIAIRKMGGGQSPIFVLQSATPDNEVLEALDKSGLTVHTIMGQYLDQEGETPPAGYRTILHGVELEIVSGDAQSWLTEHIESELLPILRQGHQRIAVLFNSVFSALVAYGELASKLEGYQVAHNTGLTPRSMKAISLQSDVVLGTATVDVGVDLKINHLIFEAHDAASFKQRLGRLGRHASYTDTHGIHKFERFTAVVCVPAWIKARLEEQCQEVMARTAFFEAIDAAYPKRGRIFAYNRSWGWIPAYDLCWRLGHPVIRKQYKDIQQDVSRSLSSALKVSLPCKRDDFKALETGDGKKLKEEAMSFRGSTALTALLVNRELTGADRYQTYDLLRVVTGAEFAPLPLKGTLDQARRDGVPEATLSREDPVIALQWLGPCEKRSQLILTVDRSDWRAIEDRVRTTVVVMTGLRLLVTPTVDLGDSAARIERRVVTARIVLDHTPSELQQRLGLGMFFPLFRFETYDQSSTGGIALGRDALLLDAAVLRLRDDNTGSFVV